jgi:hypothetical protein
MKNFIKNERDAELFKDVEYLIEASSFEQFQLWKNHGNGSDSNEQPIKNWTEDLRGQIITIGKIEDYPICVSISYAILNGHKVLFYNGCSLIVDHEMIDEWLQHCASHIICDGRWAHCNPMNFGHCLVGLKLI